MTENKSVSSQEEILSPRNSTVYDSEEPTSTDSKDFYACCFTCIFRVLISAGLSAWLIFAIIALSNEDMKDIKDDCPDSEIWPCLCTMICVCGISLILESKPKPNSNNKNNPNILGVCLNIACFIWMSIELFDNCARNKLTDYDIYKLLYIFYWIYVGAFGLLLIIVCCLGCSLCLVKEVDNKYLENPRIDNPNSGKETLDI
ncbi:hypothetical protein N9O88_01925 [bacterium]|nr:hypothetical protein [bacterium]